MEAPEEQDRHGFDEREDDDDDDEGVQVQDVPPREDSLSPGATDRPHVAYIPTSNPQLPPSYFSDPRDVDSVDDLTSHLTSTQLTPPHSPSTYSSNSTSNFTTQTRRHRRESLFAPPPPSETCQEFSPYLRDPAHLGLVCQYIHGDAHSPHPPAVQLRRRAIVRELIDRTGGASAAGGFEVLGGFIRRDRTVSVAGVAGAGVTGWRGRGKTSGVGHGDEGHEGDVVDELRKLEIGGVRIDSLTPSFYCDGKVEASGDADVGGEEDVGRKRTLSSMQGSEDGSLRSKRRSKQGGDDDDEQDRRCGGNKARKARAASEGSLQSWKQMIPAWLAAKPTLEDLVE